MRCRTLGAALLTALALASVPASAQILGGSRCRPCPPACATPQPPACLPSTPVPPTPAPREGVPPTPAPKEVTPPSPAPKEETPPAPAPETPELPMLAAGVTGGRGAAYGSPNMWGDAFCTRPAQIVVQLPPIPGVNQNVAIGHFVPNTSSQTLFFPQNNNAFVTTEPVQARGTGGFSRTFSSGLTFTSIGPIGFQNTVPVNANAQETQAVGQFATTAFGAGGTLKYLNGTATVQFDDSEVNPYTIVTNYNYFRPPVFRNVVLDIPSPTCGVVGLTKISDDNNPLPRDRVFFDYDYFNDVPLSSGGFSVHRFSPGFEKTFFDMRASVEVRFPFASTLDPDLSADGGTSRAAEFGDIHITLKGLLYTSPVFNFAAGLGIDVPTGPDTRVFLNDGTELVRIRNEAVILTPYFAYLVTPDDRLFFQNWFQFGFDANGNSVAVNPDFTSLRNVGRLSNQSFMQIDAQIGYWAYRSQDSSRWLTALAPFFELHYNTSLEKAEGIQSDGLLIQDLSGHFDELNVSLGIITQFGDNFTLALGAAFPLRGGTDRSFDYQLGLRANWFFGPTARERNRAMAVSGFAP